MTEKHTLLANQIKLLLSANPVFRAGVYALAGKGKVVGDVPQPYPSTWRGKETSHGQVTDILHVAKQFDDSTVAMHAKLVRHKTTISYESFAAYPENAHEWALKHGHSSSCAVLFAPAKWIAEHAEIVGIFDAAISLEDLSGLETSDFT